MRSALLLALLSCAFSVQARSIDVTTTARLAFPHLAAEAKKFGDFATEFKRQYTTKEEVLKRFSVFADNLETIKRKNEEAAGMTTYGITRFADMTYEEFASTMLLKGMPEFNTTRFPVLDPNPENKGLPDSWDWRQSGIVTRIKDQGQCGSCWAFATAGVVESANAKAGRGLHEYAEQQMVDCIEDGCGGGNLEHSFGYAQDHGLPTEGDYPYHASRGQCHDAHIAVKLSQLFVLPRDEEKIAWSVKDGGPAAVGFQTNQDIHLYKGGVLTSNDCAGSIYWHAVPAIGFGNQGGTPYWLIKNSWGTSWGEGGFGKFKRGSNWCNINTRAVAGGIW